MTERKLSRREFLRISAGVAAGAFCAACVPVVPEVVEGQEPEEGSVPSRREEDEINFRGSPSDKTDKGVGAVPVERREGRKLTFISFGEGGPSSQSENRYYNQPPETIPVVEIHRKLASLLDPLPTPCLKFGVPVFWQPGGRHTGADYCAAEGTPLLAVEDSLVEYVGWLFYKQPGKGRGPYTVILVWKDGKSDQTLRAIYSHNQMAVVETGHQVERGEKVAEVGRLGYMTAGASPHVHFEIYVGGEFTGNPVKPLVGGFFDDPEKYF